MTVRLGVLSTARINELVLPAARACEQTELLAVASRELSRAQRYAAEHGIERAYGSYDALLEDPELDAVYISLPNHLHIEWSERALGAGKHVLCEKPLARWRHQAEHAYDVAERAGRVLAEAFMYRHHPQTLEIKSLVDAGAIGRLRLIRASMSFMIEGKGDVRLFRALEGGALMDVGCYCVHLARFVAGEPRRVYGEQRLNDDGVDLLFSGTMRHADDVLAQFDSAIDVPARDFLELVGSEGTIDVSDPWQDGAAEPGIVIRRDGEIEHHTTQLLDPYRLQFDDFAAAINREREPLLGRADATRQAATIEALYASADSGRRVELAEPERPATEPA